MNDRSDAELLGLARAGDDAAFGVLAGRHARALLVVALAIVRDADLAEDVCQEGLFRAWRRIGDCREPDRVAAWLATIVRRQALDVVRVRGVQGVQGVQDDVPSTKPGPDRMVERSELRVKLAEALAQLTAEQRHAVLLFDLEDWPHARIAETLDTTEAMSRQHVMHGRRRLRELLEGA